MEVVCDNVISHINSISFYEANLFRFVNGS